MSGENYISKQNQTVAIKHISSPTSLIVLGEHSNIYIHDESELQSLTKKIPPIDEKYFHLLVVPGKLQPLIRVVIPSMFVLNSYMRTIDERRFGALTEEVVDLLLHFPALVVSQQHRSCDNLENHAYFGHVLAIEKHDGYSSISLGLAHKLPMSIIENNCSQFGITCGPLRTELHENHWSIKNICLASVIHKLNAENLVDPPINLMEMRN